VQHESVLDTHHVSRTNFQPDDPPPGVVRRVGPAALVVGSVASLILLGVRAARRKTVYLPQRSVAAMIGIAPVLLLIAAIITLVLALVDG